MIAPPRIEDYPSALPDGVKGEERRVTTAGVSVADALGDPRPLVSIVSIVLNNADAIERAMQSVFAQTYPNIEYILVDGGSTDETVDVVRRYGERLSYWHSAPDKGISDAFNWGVALSCGRYVGLVNSDDWMSPDQIETAVAILEDAKAPFVFGDLLYHRPDGVATYRLAGDADYQSKLWHRMPQVTHPTAVVSRDVYAQHGLFDLRWKIGMDYDWLLRLDRAGVHGRHDPQILGHMTHGGVSDARWIQCLAEHKQIGIEHGYSRAVLTALYHLRLFRVFMRKASQAMLPRRAAMYIRSKANRSVISQQ